MAGTPDVTPCCDGGQNGQAFLPVDPWRSLMPRFGMLLGVQDFETIGAYQRGKSWLHNAWLHGEGIVWGMDVRPDPERNEVRVLTGLALDALGRELHLERDACLSLPAWVEEHQKDEGFVVEQLDEGVIQIEAHVVALFHGCQMRPVPALSEPCEGAQNVTSNSRVFETIELRMIPGPPPDRERLPYHRLRILFGLTDDVSDDDPARAASFQVALDRRNAILTLPSAQQPPAYLEAFRDLAATDEIDLEPATNPDSNTQSLFPELDPAPVLLAHLQLVLTETEGGVVLTEASSSDVTVRRSHVATSTIQELLCGPLFSLIVENGEGEGNGEGGGNGEGEGGEGDSGGDSGGGSIEIEQPAEPVDEESQGPRVDAESIELTGETLTFRILGRTSKNSVAPQSITVSSYDRNDGWTVEAVKDVEFEPGNGKTIVSLKDATAGNLVRLTVHGTGPTPVLGTNHVPLGGPVASRFNGRDFVTMFKKVS